MRDVCAAFGTGLTGFDGEPSHVRPLVSFPPQVALSRLASSLKGVSSGSAGGAPARVLRHYIEQQ
jgi:putative transposase